VPQKATILLVDDDLPVLRVVSQMLVMGGYQVVEASSAEQAIETFDQRGVRIDLLLSDVLMPGMKGPDLAERLCAKDPGSKKTYSSAASRASARQVFSP